MKTSEFKKILKPLIKQTVKEVLFEEGVLSNIVSEVALGLSNQRLVTESAPPSRQASSENLEDKADRLEEEKQERIKKLNESSKLGNIFSGTKQITEPSQGPLSGVGSSDSGVDITAIQKIANGKWKHLIK
jgi:hypothetical protein|tara:strand:- start:205 stop:597 length:393 start_codon:yes stop_codon:yes gene_type:complete